MKNIRLSPTSFGLPASLFCGGATILFGCFWFLSAASQDVKIINPLRKAFRSRPPAGGLATGRRRKQKGRALGKAA